MNTVNRGASGRWELHTGDCRDVMATLDAESVDAIVSDPPYGLSFMGRGWDHGVPGVEFWAEALRVAKPGAHLLAFGGTRTYHRLTCAIEDAGWEIRDCVMWVYGSGFPKSHDVSKAITNRADPAKVREIKTWLRGQFDLSGKTRSEINRECGFTASDYLKTEPGNDAGGRATWHLLLPYGEKWETLKRVVGFGCEYDAEIERYGVVAGRRAQRAASGEVYGDYAGMVTDYTLTDAARQWAGWGTALKPAWEPVIVARKPLAGTVAENVLRHGTGGINVDGCRVAANEGRPLIESCRDVSLNAYGNGLNGGRRAGVTTQGRWPANVIHDGSDEVVGLFPHTTSNGGKGPHRIKSTDALNDNRCAYGQFSPTESAVYGDSGSAARFFYCAKASKADRGPDNNHPTVKPTALMRYLCRLVTPPGGVVLDPFCGSGSTGKGALLEGFRFVGIEREAEYATIARGRLAKAALGRG